MKSKYDLNCIEVEARVWGFLGPIFDVWHRLVQLSKTRKLRLNELESNNSI